MPISFRRDIGLVMGQFSEYQNPAMRWAPMHLERASTSLNLKHAYALQFAYYNFCRVHQTLRVTPAMESGIADHIWEIQELIANNTL